jgi:hypothetical protein
LPTLTSIGGTHDQHHRPRGNTNGERIVGGRYDGQLDAVHAGLIVRLEPAPLAIEGNTSLAALERDGLIPVLE